MFETGPAGILRPVVNSNSSIIPEVLSRPGQARGVDPATSKAAAGMVKAKAGSSRVLLLGAYIGVDGLTDEEAADRAGVNLLSEYATRISELVRYQMLEQTGAERLGRSGVPRRVCRITDYGRHVMGKRNAVSHSTADHGGADLNTRDVGPKPAAGAGTHKSLVGGKS